VHSAIGGPSNETFEAFAERERTSLVALAWALTGSMGSAEELAQDALTAAWEGWDRVGGLDRPGAWTRRVVINRAAGVRRRAFREHRAIGRLVQRDTGAPALTLEMSTESGELWAALRSLSPRQAQVLALHYLDDRPVAEIATILDCTQATVRVHLHRGRRALARRLSLTEEHR
jgi:RNA polymerase sigma-70 factor (ECF subfamily)